MSGISDTRSVRAHEDVAGTPVPWVLPRAELLDAVLGDLAVRGVGGLEAAELAEGLLVALDASLTHEAPGLLVDELLGQQERLSRLAPGLRLGTVVAVLSATLAGTLPEVHWARVSRLLAVAVGQLRDLSGAGGRTPGLSPLTLEFLRLVLCGRRRDALRLVVAEVELGATADELLVEVVEPSLFEAERRRRSGEIDAGQERHCAVVTEQVMAMLFAPRLDARPERPRAVTLALGVDSADTRIRTRVVSDLLERQGWRVAAAAPAAAGSVVADLVAEQTTHVLAVAAELPHHVEDVERMLAVLRGDDRCAGIRVVVGGPPFVRAPGLAEQLGADAVAAGARGYVVRCEELLAQGLGDGQPFVPRQRRGLDSPHPGPEPAARRPG